MKLVDEQYEFLLDVAKLINYASSIGIKITGGELYRTKQQQELYIKEGKSKTMNSYHLKRLAIDFNFFINDILIYNKELLQPLGDFWESLNTKNKWGGNFKTFIDTPHFERRIK